MSKKKSVKPAAPVRKPQPRPAASSSAARNLLPSAPAIPGGWIVGLIAAALGFVLYINTFGHQWALDDYSVIKENWVVKGGLENLRTIFTTEYRYGAWNSPGSLYRPVTLAMFAWEWSISPDNPAIHHIINVLFYALTGWVLWVTWRRILADYPPVLAAMAVLFFMAHPVHTEVVANIKSRDEILSLLLCTGALYGIWKHMETNRTAWLTAALGMYTLAQFSKEGSITFLAVLPLTLWYFGKRNMGEIVRYTAMFLAPALIFLAIRHNVLANQAGKEIFSILDNFIAAEKNPAMRLASAFMMCGRYLWVMIYPHPLISDLGYPQMKSVGFDDWRALAGFFAYAGMGIWALMNLRKKHFLSYAILFYLATFSLYSNVVYIIGTSYGERELYIPSLGFAFALAWVLMKIFKVEDRENGWNFNGKGALLWGIAGAIILAYSVKTVLRNPAWYDSYALYVADMPNSPNCAKLNYHIGLEEAKRGLDEKKGIATDTAWVEKGIASYSKAIELYPEYHDAYGSRGVAQFRLGRYDQAEKDYQMALKYRPNDTKVLSNLGYIYFLRAQRPGNQLMLTQLDSAESVYRRSVQFDPRFVDARRNLGAVLAMKKKFPEAIEQWKEALKYDKNNPTLLYYIGSAYWDMGQKDAAQPWLDKAYAIEPSLPRKQ